VKPSPLYPRPCSTERPASGLALIEALVASAVLGMGLAGAIRLTMHTLQTSSDTRQNSVAHSLGVDAMECLKSGRLQCDRQLVTTVQGTPYTVRIEEQPRPDLSLMDLQVRVQWPAVAYTPGSGAKGLAQRQGELVLHSSRDAVSAWHGVSSP
jgi:hypothetical protein